MRLTGAMIAIGLLASCGMASDRSPNETADAIGAGKFEVIETSTPPSPANAAGRSSVYSPIDDKACRTIEEDKETGDWVGLCPGVAGRTLEWSISDLRDDVTIIEGSTRTQLNIPGLVANGAFASLGSKAEWRGPAGGKPDVFIVRVHVANPDGVSDAGRLAIARLGPAPCLVAIVPPGKDQSDRARAIADGKLPACLKA